jgi:hypothetical protein
MAFRTWMIRGSILAVLTCIGYGLWWAQSYVSPGAVRASLLETLQEQFPDADVMVGSAQIRVFGGISVRNLTITRKGADQPFFRAPSGTIYHDKEQMARGRLAIRKVELEDPHLVVERRADGTWNFEGLGINTNATSGFPAIVVQGATLQLIDRTDEKRPPAEITDFQFTLVNDPAPYYVIVKGGGTVRVGSTFTTRFSGAVRLHRKSNRITVRVDLPELTLDEATTNIAEQIRPEWRDYLRGVEGTVAVKAEWTHEPNAPLQYDLSLNARELNYLNDLLPVPIRSVRGSTRIRDGVVTVDNLTARIGDANLKLSLETRKLDTGSHPAPPDGSAVPAMLVSRTGSSIRESPFDELERNLERIDLTLGDVILNEELFDRLPADFGKLKSRFAPSGSLAIGYRFSRPKPDTWRREVEWKPRNAAILYEKFRMPVTDLHGVVRQLASPNGDEAKIELTGTAGGQRIDITGTLRGPGPDPAIALKISGTGLAFDDTLAEAFPIRQHAELFRSLRASGRADFSVDVKQEAGQNLVENVIRLEVYDVALNYKKFPYSLDKLRGRINLFVTVNDADRPIRPGEPITPLPENDRIEIREVTARHGDGTVWLKGDSVPLPNSSDRKLALSVWGKDCPIDRSFHDAIKALKLGLVLDVLKPEGRLTFAVDAEAIDRRERVAGNPVGPRLVSVQRDGYARLASLARTGTTVEFDPATDLKLAFNFEGPTVTPEFFPYRMDDLAGRLRYEGSRVKLERLSARHAASKLGLNAAEVRFYDDGRVWANLGQIDASPLVVDEELIAALPRGLRSGVKEMNLRGPADLSMKHMVVLTPASTETNLDPEVFWKGELRLAGASFDAGVPCESVFGRLACTGSYLPTHLGKVTGNIWLDSASFASHPALAVKAAFDADPQEPDPANPLRRLPPAIKFTDIQGKLFNGTVGGTGRVVLADPARYRLALTATDIRLEDIARHHNLGQGARMEGAAQASILLETIADPTTGKPLLTGYGKADVDRGQIYNLPPLVPLLKALKLQAPDKTAFEEAHAVFTVRGDRIRVDHVDLLGSAISLGGSGELNANGSFVKFDFYTIWSQTLQRWLTTPFGDLTAMVSEKLFKIEVTRKPDGELKYEPRPVPLVTDPFKAVAERIKARATKSPTARANAGP